MGDLDSLVDMVSEDATVADLRGTDDSIIVEADTAAQLSKKPGAETEEEFLSDEEDENPEYTDEDFEHLDASADEEGQPDEDLNGESDLDGFEEVEWYGVKDKIGKRLHGFLNKKFTETQQSLAEQRRQMEQEVAAAKADAARQLEEARALQQEIQAHLDANPEFQESWNYEVQRVQKDRELQKQVEELRQFQEQFKAQRARDELDAEFARLDSAYKLHEGAPVSLDDVREMAVARCVGSNYQVDLEHAYQEIVGRFNKSAKKSSLRRLQNAVQSEKASAVPTRRRKAPVKTKSVKPKGLDALLRYHLSKPKEYFG